MTQSTSLFHAARLPLRVPRRKVHRSETSQVAGVWLPRKPTPSASGSRPAVASSMRPSYVYLFVHATENRFKIGRSKSPATRLAQLPEAEQIDRTQSLQVLLPDRRRAEQVESLLHKGLAGFRLQLSWLGDSTGLKVETSLWDGATEWFSLAGLRHAMALLRALPGLTQQEGPVLQTLNGQTYWADRNSESLQGDESSTLETARYNVGQLDQIADVLMQLRRQLSIRWIDGCDPKASAGTLLIEGLRPRWNSDILAPRLQLTNTDLWTLKTGKSPNKSGTCPQAFTPLVKLIRYAADAPDDLELVFNALHVIRKLPAGDVILRRCQSLGGKFTESHVD
jgi:hypothetical protein